ncbi:TFIIB-type zinc ribbon-containing protein [Halodesulfurarchaeum sp. HSR-GB]|uniref:Uncharacterized protein n=1 Tax=Halodesulfurarchaeum formicicum TaxID=1873524 RepID=A0A1J1ABA4_9EURY|nr:MULTISPECIES: hypothetical protein [Halodesulfurarchaeum]APE95157.1 hypothetical protein HSR6_0698 [Halodesulfurarchaeum formicicum]MDR5657556.1 TFIIB-type zinc ribbon-containing protein [Halodesulfurarchaeum sp. HSR-GB]
MEVRGIRECKDCGTQWSYYETGSPACPACGSLYSVGISDRALHTDRPADLDLTAAIDALADGDDRAAGDAAAETARTYVHRRGFINAGELQPLSATYVAAHEIRHVAALLDRATPTGIDGETVDREYVTALFEAASEGRRPPASAVPESMIGPRGLGVADAIRDYHDGLKTWLDGTDADRDVDSYLERLDSHVRRIRALDGSIDPAEGERLLAAARSLGDYLANGDGDLQAVDEALGAVT